MAATYVALGDSYAAGVGAGARSGPCWRSQGGYPLQVAASLGVDLSWQACIAATTVDVRRDQVRALGPRTRTVSITAGGNDVGFAPVLISAAEPSWVSDTDALIDRALVALRMGLPGLLDELYDDVRRAAPRADVLVTTYPRLFNGEDCSLFTFFDAEEMQRLNDAADELAHVVIEAAARAGFDCIDVREAFEGHAACAEHAWIHNVSWPVEESFHPTPAGYGTYARLIGAHWGTHRDAHRGTHWGTESTAPTGADIAVSYGPVWQGSAQTFRLADLLSGPNLAGAAAHGLDPDQVATLARRAPRDAAARQRLRALDRQVRQTRAHQRA